MEEERSFYFPLQLVRRNDITAETLWHDSRSPTAATPRAPRRPEGGAAGLSLFISLVIDSRISQ